MWAIRFLWFDSSHKRTSKLRWGKCGWCLDSRRTKWKRGGFVESWVTTFDRSVIRKIAGGKAVKCPAAKPLRAQRYVGAAHGETGGLLKEGTETKRTRFLTVTLVDNSPSVDKHADANACVAGMSAHTRTPITPLSSSRLGAEPVNAVSKNSECGSENKCREGKEKTRRSKRKTFERLDGSRSLAVLWRERKPEQWWQKYSDPSKVQKYDQQNGFKASKVKVENYPCSHIHIIFVIYDLIRLLILVHQCISRILMLLLVEVELVLTILYPVGKEWVPKGHKIKLNFSLISQFKVLL